MRVALCILMIFAVAACGSGGSGEASPTNVSQPPPANNAPTISGAPSTQVVEGQPYSFTPTANDADGDTLTFSIENRPSWASFDTVTGNLAGTPSQVDIGVTLDITISVSDGTDFATLAPFNLEVQQLQLGSATVSWDAPTTNADGTPLEDLAGFNVHYGQESQNYSEIAVINDDTATSALIEDLAPGTWYFAVSAFDLAGNRGALSAEVSKVVSQ